MIDYVSMTRVGTLIAVVIAVILWLFAPKNQTSYMVWILIGVLLLMVLVEVDEFRSHHAWKKANTPEKSDNVAR